jgi:hypothetical protein
MVQMQLAASLLMDLVLAIGFDLSCCIGCADIRQNRAWPTSLIAKANTLYSPG